MFEVGVTCKRQIIAMELKISYEFRFFFFYFQLDDFNPSDQFNSITNSDNIKKDIIPFKIKTTDGKIQILLFSCSVTNFYLVDTEGLITQALLLNNVEAAVGLCLKAKRFADALIIATTGNITIMS